MFEKPAINSVQSDAQNAWTSITRPCGVDFLVLLRGFGWTRERYIAEYCESMGGSQ